MGFIVQRITVIQTRRPPRATLNEELQWFAHALGLFGERDRDRSCFRLFLELLKATRLGEALSSEELAAACDLSRGTVVHHLNALMERGFVVQEGRRYLLRSPYLERMVDDIARDFERAAQELRRAAHEIDTILGG